jgi:hypothetical protein
MMTVSFLVSSTDIQRRSGVRHYGLLRGWDKAVPPWAYDGRPAKRVEGVSPSDATEISSIGRATPTTKLAPGCIAKGVGRRGLGRSAAFDRDLEVVVLGYVSSIVVSNRHSSTPASRPAWSGRWLQRSGHLDDIVLTSRRPSPFVRADSPRRAGGWAGGPGPGGRSRPSRCRARWAAWVTASRTQPARLTTRPSR